MKKYIILLALTCCLLAGCSTEYSAVYQSVDAESKWDISARIIINDSKLELAPYIVKESKLYLVIQSTQVDWLIHSVTTYPIWGKAETDRLITENTDIASLIPKDWNNWLPKGYGDECKEKITLSY